MALDELGLIKPNKRLGVQNHCRFIHKYPYQSSKLEKRLQASKEKTGANTRTEKENPIPLNAPKLDQKKRVKLGG